MGLRAAHVRVQHHFTCYLKIATIIQFLGKKGFLSWPTEPGERSGAELFRTALCLHGLQYVGIELRAAPSA
jgi:hypothetical protein